MLHQLIAQSMPAGLPTTTVLAPVVLTRVRSRLGQELTFLSTFSMHLDITVASLWIEYLIPARPQTRQAMTYAFEQ